MKKEMPTLLFKYRALKTDEDISRFFDILRKRQLYFPTMLELNDPYEGTAVSFEPAYAGSWLTIQADEEFEFVRDCKSKIRVLSLSETCFATTMWVHYASEFSGACIGFYTEEIFKNANKINYGQRQIYKRITTQPPENCCVDDFIIKHLLEGAYYKQNKWRDEEEWRIVQINKGKKLSFKKDDLACLIFGDKTDSDIVDQAKSIIPQNIPVLTVHNGKQSGRMSLEYKPYEYTGEKRDSIKTISELEKWLMKQ